MTRCLACKKYSTVYTVVRIQVNVYMHIFFIRNRFIRNFVVRGLKIKKLFRLIIKREEEKVSYIYTLSNQWFSYANYFCQFGTMNSKKLDEYSMLFPDKSEDYIPQT